MAINKYSLRQDGDKQLSANFRVREFACKDGSDTIYICDALVALLQNMRDHFGQPVTINSAYRTEAYNKKIGGATNSQHTKGTAADITVKGITPLAVAQYAESLGADGIGLYAGFTHIDTRANKYRWDQRSGKEVAVAGFGGQAVPDYAAVVKQKAGLDSGTMAYLQEYKYGEALLEKLAKAMI